MNNNTDQTKLSYRVAKALKKTGKTNEQLAQTLGVNKNTISAYRNEKGDIKGIVIENLVRKYGFSPVWLLTGQGDEKAVTGKDIQTELPNDQDNIEFGKALEILSKGLESDNKTLTRVIMANLWALSMITEMIAKESKTNQQLQLLEEWNRSLRKQIEDIKGKVKTDIKNTDYYCPKLGRQVRLEIHHIGSKEKKYRTDGKMEGCDCANICGAVGDDGHYIWDDCPLYGHRF